MNRKDLFGPGITRDDSLSSSNLPKVPARRGLTSANLPNTTGTSSGQSSQSSGASQSGGGQSGGGQSGGGQSGGGQSGGGKEK